VVVTDIPLCMESIAMATGSGSIWHRWWCEIQSPCWRLSYSEVLRGGGAFLEMRKVIVGELSYLVVGKEIHVFLLSCMEMMSGGIQAMNDHNLISKTV